MTQHQAAEAAALCDTCPGATSCLLEALRIHAAHHHDQDRFGITGVCAGVWFEPGAMPRRIAHTPTCDLPASEPPSPDKGAGREPAHGTEHTP